MPRDYRHNTRYGRQAIGREIEYQRTASPAEKACERFMRRLKLRRNRSLTLALQGCTTSSPDHPNECRVHLWWQGEARDIRVLADGSVRWARRAMPNPRETWGDAYPVAAE